MGVGVVYSRSRVVHYVMEGSVECVQFPSNSPVMNLCLGSYVCVSTARHLVTLFCCLRPDLGAVVRAKFTGIQ